MGLTRCYKTTVFFTFIISYDDDDGGGDGVDDRYMIDKEHDGPLVSMDVKEFILTVGARSPTPGGGSVAAVTAALVSLLLYVVSVTRGQLNEQCSVTIPPSPFRGNSSVQAPGR